MRALKERELRVGADRYKMVTADRLQKGRAGDETRETKKHRGRDAVGDEQTLGVEDLRIDIGSRRQQEVSLIGSSWVVGVMEGVVDPQNIEGAALVERLQPGEIFRMSQQPEA